MNGQSSFLIFYILRKSMFMKSLLVAFFCCCTFFSFAQNKQAATVKSVLLEQLKTTHNKKEWFVPVNTAVEGLTPEQAMWKDSSGNHSVGQLVNHFNFLECPAACKI